MHSPALRVSYSNCVCSTVAWKRTERNSLCLPNSPIRVHGHLQPEQTFGLWGRIDDSGSGGIQDDAGPEGLQPVPPTHGDFRKTQSGVE